jgi:hypothetical protein
MNRRVLMFFLGLAACSPLQAEPARVREAQWPAALMCDFSVSGQQFTKRFPAVGNPYDANVERIGEHFAFRAVPMSSNGRDLDYVSLYTYYPARQKLILLHTVQYKPAPHFQTDQVNTGVNRVYSPVFERELIYSCHSEAS